MIIKFIQANLGRGKAATDECEVAVSQKGTDIACLQEPYHERNVWGEVEIHGVENAWALTVVLNTRLCCIFLEGCSNEDMTVSRLETEGGPLIIINIYWGLRCNYERKLDELAAVVNKHVGDRVLLLGDFNAKHTQWGGLLTMRKSHVIERQI